MEGDDISDFDTDADPREVVGSVDRAGSREEFIIADISCDEQWLRIGHSEAPTLGDWR